MQSVNSVLSGTAVTSTAQSSVNLALQKSKPTSSAKALFNDAKPTINKVIAMAACGATEAQMGAYTDPSGFSSNYIRPMSNMQYHKSGCVDVLRINDIKKIAANAIGFSVTYQSSQSQESSRRTYEAIKQPDGEWLFKWSLIGLSG